MKSLDKRKINKFKKFTSIVRKVPKLAFSPNKIATQ